VEFVEGENLLLFLLLLKFFVFLRQKNISSHIREMKEISTKMFNNEEIGVEEEEVEEESGSGGSLRSVGLIWDPTNLDLSLS